MMDGLDKVEKILIVTLVVSATAMLLLAGLSIYSVGTHHDYGMKTVRTGDVTWVCLTDHGTTIGCDTVKEYR